MGDGWWGVAQVDRYDFKTPFQKFFQIRFQNPFPKIFENFSDTISKPLSKNF
jgi:hypothetical protein